jgi:hypothetical protein
MYLQLGDYVWLTLDLSNNNNSSGFLHTNLSMYYAVHVAIDSMTTAVVCFCLQDQLLCNNNQRTNQDS